MSTVIKIENLWKEYRLGVIGHGTLVADLQSWWARVRGKEDPNSRVQMHAGQEKQIEGDRFLALRGINLQLEQGEILGIIGKNGAGKSTILKILSRVTAPTKGCIKVKGRIASLLEVGTGFHPELTGRENVYLNGAILGMSKQETKSKLDEIIEFSGVADFIDTPVKRYSSGMYVRLAFAVAAHLDPEIMIVDEVLAVGDTEFQKKCIGKMGQVAQTGRTILFVSHNMASVQNLCNRAVIIEAGQISADGSVEKIISRYLEQTDVSMNRKQLGKRQDRVGGVKFRFTDVKFLDFHTNRPQEALISGNDYKIQFMYMNQHTLENVNISIAISNSSGGVVCSFSSKIVNKKYEIKKGEGEICCIVKKFPLSEGIYTFKVYASANNETVDMVEGAGHFNVVGGDFYGTGVLPPLHRPSVLVDYSYE
jgi:lipopolysaccharide transport system ATP-binding protein